MAKKKRTLIVLEYPSGTVNRGKPKSKIVKSILTPKQYEDRYYRSDDHFKTENAIWVGEVK